MLEDATRQILQDSMHEKDYDDPFADVEDEDDTGNNEACIDLDEDNSEGSGSNTSSDEQVNFLLYLIQVEAEISSVY